MLMLFLFIYLSTSYYLFTYVRYRTSDKYLIHEMIGEDTVWILHFIKISV